MGKMVRMTLEQIKASRPSVDRARIDATTEDDIRRYMIEDGYDPDYEPDEVRLVLPAKAVRQKLGMTQEAFAIALRIPLATLRNWEQGRTMPDPAAQSLLRAVARDPRAVLAAIAG
jgi:putative transcriptional regulator